MSKKAICQNFRFSLYHVLSLSSGDSACPHPHLLIILLSSAMPESLATDESSCLLEFFPRLQKPDFGRFPVARRFEDRRKKGDLKGEKDEN